MMFSSDCGKDGYSRGLTASIRGDDGFVFAIDPK